MVSIVLNLNWNRWTTLTISPTPPGHNDWHDAGTLGTHTTTSHPHISRQTRNRQTSPVCVSINWNSQPIDRPDRDDNPWCPRFETQDKMRGMGWAPPCRALPSPYTVLHPPLIPSLWMLFAEPEPRNNFDVCALSPARAKRP